MKSILCLCLLLAAANVFAAEKAPQVLATGSTVGAFQSFVWGDYAHIEIKVKGKTRSYFCMEGPCSVFEENEAKLKGRQIKIIWQKVRMYVPEAGGYQVLVQTKDICSLNKMTETSTLKEKVSVCK